MTTEQEFMKAKSVQYAAKYSLTIEGLDSFDSMAAANGMLIAATTVFAVHTYEDDDAAERMRHEMLNAVADVLERHEVPMVPRG